MRSAGPGRAAPASSIPTPPECPPPPESGCLVPGARSTEPRPPPIRPLDAVPLPLPGGTEVPHAVRLPCRTFVSTNAMSERRVSLRLLIDWLQNQCHCTGESIPFRLFGSELFTPGRRQAIELRPLTFPR